MIPWLAVWQDEQMLHNLDHLWKLWENLRIQTQGRTNNPYDKEETKSGRMAEGKSMQRERDF